MSATTAIHSVAIPRPASARNTAFSPSDSAMLTWMLRTVDRLRRTA